MPTTNLWIFRSNLGEKANQLSHLAWPRILFEFFKVECEIRPRFDRGRWWNWTSAGGAKRLLVVFSYLRLAITLLLAQSLWSSSEDFSDQTMKLFIVRKLNRKNNRGNYELKERVERFWFCCFFHSLDISILWSVWRTLNLLNLLLHEEFIF